MDILTCALIKHIILNNINKSKSSNHCENSNDLINPKATPIIPSLSCGAAKLQMLDLIQDKTHS